MPTGHTPTPVLGVDTDEVRQALADRDAMDHRIDGRADDRILVHASKCPAVRGYNRLLGALMIVSAIGLGFVALAWHSITSTVETSVLKMATELRKERAEEIHRAVKTAMRGKSFSPIPMARAASEDE